MAALAINSDIDTQPMFKNTTTAELPKKIPNERTNKPNTMQRILKAYKISRSDWNVLMHIVFLPAGKLIVIAQFRIIYCNTAIV